MTHSFLVVFAPLAAVLSVAVGCDASDPSSTVLAITPSVTAGYEHTCEVKADGSVVCWGSNRYGQATSPGGGICSRLRGLQPHVRAADRRHGGLLGGRLSGNLGWPERGASNPAGWNLHLALRGRLAHVRCENGQIPRLLG
jgi:Regulator of chromosome condensation (RCC1) repeat